MSPVLLSDFQYDLPDDRIARFPLAERDQSRLLVYRAGVISHARFDQIGDFLPERSLLVFNNTKVIPARLFFRRTSGALIELFLLQPVEPTPVIQQAMQATGSCTWECLIGNRKRWKAGERLGLSFTVYGLELKLSAELVDSKKSLVRFSWEPEAVPFAEILRAAGQIPLPPYLNRAATEADRQTYQTVYSEPEGAVAAPTAGLHFTENVLSDLRERGFGEEFLTLHVGAGTFQPVKVANALDHPMHGEQVIFTKKNIEVLLENRGRILPVGTTSLRAIESLYWLGAKLKCEGRRVNCEVKNQNSPLTNGGKNHNSHFSFHPFHVGQFEPYQHPDPPAPEVALEAVLRQMTAENLDEITGQTEIMIVPGYQFRLCRGLVTNFHQPGSTLILLVAALLGADGPTHRWRRVYDEALARGYRFLSYGDSSLLLP